MMYKRMIMHDNDDDNADTHTDTDIDTYSLVFTYDIFLSLDQLWG